MESTSNASTVKYSGLFTFKFSLKSGLFLILLASYSFLTYKILTFDHYRELAVQWKQMPLTQLWWFAGVFTLLPVNWFLEALKWKIMTRHVQKINLNSSVQAVLSGISTGFFTPNRVGELVGRVALLHPENRKAGITLSMINSLTQNLIMALCGIPACLFYFSFTDGKLHPDVEHLVFLVLMGILLFGTIYFSLPVWSRHLNSSRLSGKIKTFTDCLTYYNRNDLLQVMGVSLVRYGVFCFQFYCMLQFFGVALTPWQALLAIPTTYLFVTFTPSFAFSEVAVRSSYAVLIIGAFSGQVIGIALAGVCIWVVNFVLPMLAGSVIMVKKKQYGL